MPPPPTPTATSTRVRLTTRGRVVVAGLALLLVLGVGAALQMDGGAAKVGLANDVGSAQSVVVEQIQGVATWYGPGMEGGTTASGQPFDPSQLTAAHFDLPFGTRVRVAAPDGNAVIVRINDRLPDQQRSRIDLTEAAFGRLADLAAGRLDVTLEVLAP